MADLPGHDGCHFSLPTLFANMPSETYRSFILDFFPAMRQVLHEWKLQHGGSGRRGSCLHDNAKQPASHHGDHLDARFLDDLDVVTGREQ